MKENIYKRNLLVPFLKIGADIAAVFLAVFFAYYLRFYSPLTELVPVTKGYPPLQNYLYFSFFLIAIFMVLFAVFNSYRSRFFSNFAQDVPVIFKTCLLGVLFAMSGAFLYREFSYSRLVFVLIFLNTNIFLLASRAIFHRFKKTFLLKGFSVLQVLLTGSPENVRQVFRRFWTHGEPNFKVTAYLSEEAMEELPIPHLGKPEALARIMEDESAFDGIVIAFNQKDHSHILEVLKAAEGKNVELFYVPDILEILTSKFQSFDIGGVPVLRLKAFLLSGWQGLIKRTFDLVVAGLSLIILSPFFFFIALMVKIASPGPVFYAQKRVGLDGREFDMLKFRSMHADAEAQTGPVWTQENDPRTTTIGKILRRTSLDELPQLINVLKGEMSLVGPRPERRHFVEQFQQYIPQYVERQRVRSGMTGWAQVNGMRGQTPIEERTKYDLYYIENWSLLLDLKIIIMTFIEIMRGENAY